MARLRAPGGCPWDREQTFDTIKPFLLEETYEVMDAIDARDWPELAGELGDLLLQAVFFSQMASEEKLFRIDDALDAINAKLIRRHPHVFGDETAKTEGDVRKRWNEIKAEEKRKQRRSRNYAARLGAALPAGAGRGAADRLARRAGRLRLGECRPGAGQAGRRTGASSTKRARSGSQRELGRRTRRPALRAGESGALREGGSRAGAAQDQRQVPPALRLCRAEARRARQVTPAESSIEEMEALWQEAKK